MNVDSPFKSPLTAISIGPGIRGIERGVERVIKLRSIAYVEIEAFIIANLVAGMEAGVLDPAVIWSDCKTFPSELFRRKVDLLLAGYPCQPFSNAGKRRGVDDPRHLYPHIERSIRIIRPAVCFFENVRGHVTCGLPEVIESLEGLGYRVRWGIFSAEETGASHKRERVFILALGNTELQSIDTRFGWVWRKSDPAGSKLADSYNNGERARSREVESQSSEIESEEQRQERNEILGQRVRAELGNGSSGELADSISKGLEVRREQSAREEQQTVERSRYVARPGESQYTWEESRTIESGVGCTVNGYNFREDFLRALGNSVVEQTAELAFKTLLQNSTYNYGYQEK